jgi:hypothetical protein
VYRLAFTQTSGVLQDHAIPFFPRRQDPLSPFFLMLAQRFDLPSDRTGRILELRGVGEGDDVLGQAQVLGDVRQELGGKSIAVALDVYFGDRPRVYDRRRRKRALKL